MQFDSHPFVLNALLLQPSIRRSRKSDARESFANRLERLVREARERRCELVDTVIRTESGVSVKPLQPAPGYYKPLLYALWGSLDAAALYFAPGPYHLPSGSPLQDIGQSRVSCFLPKPPKGSKLVDINKCYFDAIKSELPDKPTKRLPPSFRFFGMIRIKLGPFATWPDDEANVTGAFERSLERVWEVVANWRKPNKSGSKVPHENRHAALALTLGWNELLVLAHSDQPHGIVQLTYDIRQLMERVAMSDVLLDGEPMQSKDMAHVCLTTHATLGFDLAFETRAERALQAIAADQEVNREELEKMAAAIGKDLGDPVHPDGGVAQLVIQTQCRVAPGHEHQLVKACGVASERSPGFLIGQRDVSLPPIYVASGNVTDKESVMPPVAASVLTCLLRHWLDRSATDAGSFFNASSTLALDVDMSQPDLAKRHIQFGPAEVFGLKLLRERVKELSLDDTLRFLQVSHARSEQIQGLVHTFRWAWESLHLWENAAEVAAAMFALRAYLNSVCAFLENGTEIQVDPLAQKPVVKASDNSDAIGKDHLVNNSKAAVQVFERLDYESIGLVKAFRNVLQSPHWTGFHLSEVTEVNVRYRGSVDQIASVAQMIVSTLVHSMVGKRACLVTLGDVESLEAQVFCDVVVVQLPAAAADTPILINRFAEELAKILILELTDPEQDILERHEWNGYEDADGIAFLRRLFQDVGRFTPDDELSIWGLRYFIAAEALDQSLDEAVRSSMLCATLVLRPVQFDGKGLPPSQGLYLHRFVPRWVLAYAANALADTEWSARPEEGGTESSNDAREFDRVINEVQDKLKQLREVLVRCVPHKDGYDVVFEDAAAWDALVKDVLRRSGWFRTPNSLRAVHAFLRELKGYMGRCHSRHDKVLLPKMLAHLAELQRAYFDAAEDTIIYRSWKDRVGNLQARTVRFTTKNNPTSIESIISQRGRVIAANREREKALMTAIGAFHGHMLALLPAWRAWQSRIVDGIEERIYEQGRERRGQARTGKSGDRDRRKRAAQQATEDVKQKNSAKGSRGRASKRKAPPGEEGDSI